MLNCITDKLNQQVGLRLPENINKQELRIIAAKKGFNNLTELLLDYISKGFVPDKQLYITK